MKLFFICEEFHEKWSFFFFLLQFFQFFWRESCFHCQLCGISLFENILICLDLNLLISQMLFSVNFYNSALSFWSISYCQTNPLLIGQAVVDFCFNLVSKPKLRSNYLLFQFSQSFSMYFSIFLEETALSILLGFIITFHKDRYKSEDLVTEISSDYISYENVKKLL